MKYKTKFPSPKGFKVSIVKIVESSRCSCEQCRKLTLSHNEYEVRLYDNKREQNKIPIGIIKLYAFGERNKSPYYETHATLNYHYHNKGLGLLLYKRAIEFCHQNLFRIASSNSPSFLARRLWKSKRLKQIFYTRIRNERTYVYPKR